MQTVGQGHLPLQVNRYCNSSEILHAVLMKTASENISIDGVCRDLEQSVSGNRIFCLATELSSVSRSRHRVSTGGRNLAPSVKQTLLIGTVCTTAPVAYTVTLWRFAGFASYRVCQT